MRFFACFLTVLALVSISGCSRRTEHSIRSRGSSGSADSLADSSDSPERAADVIRGYYRAIAERRYRDAYEAWARNGAASGQSFEEFERGYANTATVEVILAAPGQMEGAAGSRYIRIPVRVTARLRDGTPQSFVGSYTLRRSVVDGATLQERAWHIESAEIRRER